MLKVADRSVSATSQNSMMGRRTRNTSRLLASWKSFRMIPIFFRNQPAKMTKKTGIVAFRLNSRLLMSAYQ